MGANVSLSTRRERPEEPAGDGGRPEARRVTTSETRGEASVAQMDPRPGVGPDAGASGPGDSDSEQDSGLESILQYLIRRQVNCIRSMTRRCTCLSARSHTSPPSGRGHIRLIVDDSSTNYQLSDSDDEGSLCSDYSERSRSRCYVPSADANPDTSALDTSDLKQLILLQSGQSLDGNAVPSLPSLITERELGARGRSSSGPSPQWFSRSNRCRLASHFLPNKKELLEQYPSKAFCGFFSKSGSLFITACQDCNIRIYDTRYGRFELIKTVWARDVGWSILDTDISPDGRHFIYSSWSECIHICNVFGDSETHDALPLSPEDRRFCIFATRFSQDGREILGGANDKCLYVYDREANSRVLRIRCHEDDVNSVAFADSSSQILFSGGDDGVCKVWDRRTLHEMTPKPVGILAGHTDGLTYIDPKGDGRHLITNSKDQTIKLWDMRVFSPPEGLESTRKAVAKQNWDYRWQAVPRKLLGSRKRLMGDTSLMTYRGHSVLQTLIRCHFSPEATTGQQYIYTGCASGRVVIYDVLTGKVVKTLSGHNGCVRDIAWHPFVPELISTSWDGSVSKWYYVDEAVLTEEVNEKPLRRSQRLADKLPKLRFQSEDT